MSFVSLSAGGDSYGRSEAEKAAQQVWHDEQVSRAFNAGAAYAIIRIFECGCYYIDRHAYQSSTPGRKAAPHSTYTSVHDFCRGPCGKAKCANIKCPGWWYTEEGRNHYGPTDVEDCEEIISEVEKWEERIQKNIENYRALSSRVKEMIHDMTYELDLERLGWVLLYSPSWETLMLKEWCPELHDVKEWQRRAIEMAFNGAPREHYEFCIDAAWESLKVVHSKVRDQLEPTILELQKRQRSMPTGMAMPQEPVSSSAPDSPVSPRSLPKPKASTKAKGTPFHSHFSRFSASIVNTQTPDWESAVDYITTEELRQSIFPETQASAGAQSLDYFSQSTRRRGDQVESQISTSVLVIEAPEEPSRESSFSDAIPDAITLSSDDIASYLRSDSDSSMTEAPSPSHSLSVPKKGRKVSTKPTQRSRQSRMGDTAEGAYSSKHPNVALPSEATAMLYDAFAGSESLSSWSSGSSMPQDAASISEPRREWSNQIRFVEREELEPVEYLSTSTYSSTSSFVAGLLALDEPASTAVFEPRPQTLAPSLSQTMANSRKRTRGDLEGGDNVMAPTHPRKRIRYNFEDEASTVTPTHPGKRSRPSSLKATPNYSSLRELLGTRVRKLSERYDSDPQELSDGKIAPPGYNRIVTTTFLISSTLSADHSAMDIDTTSTTTADATKPTTNKLESKGEVYKSSGGKMSGRGSNIGSSRRTVRDRLRGLAQNFRVWKLFIGGGAVPAVAR
ncbi:hypothetical protein EV356DRAFT_578626 [Viridothelium virens]|uniref:Uncharacterized protein n=1 Tax=Viridothelium virens TaxID=1048519 RepID=A0A6A6H2V2_VIRVR|nr:hypothetical protein EV356DRAFT_578626 [Viridothelium virens]